MGRSAPVPLTPMRRGDGKHLNPALPEWMLGFPEGWITDVPGLTYYDQMRLSGNAVCPQQCALALEILGGV